MSISLVEPLNPNLGVGILVNLNYIWSDLYILLSFRVADIFPENLPTRLAMHSYAFSCITMFFCTLLSLFMRKRNIANNNSFSDMFHELKKQKTTVLSWGAKAEFQFQSLSITIFMTLLKFFFLKISFLVYCYKIRF